MVGVHCHFGPEQLLDAMELVKEGLEEAKLKCHMMVQPIAYVTPDASKQGFIDLPEFPFGKTAQVPMSSEVPVSDSERGIGHGIICSS